MIVHIHNVQNRIICQAYTFVWGIPAPEVFSEQMDAHAKHFARQYAV
jgi:hypothetical protein